MNLVMAKIMNGASRNANPPVNAQTFFHDTRNAERGEFFMDHGVLNPFVFFYFQIDNIGTHGCLA